MDRIFYGEEDYEEDDVEDCSVDKVRASCLYDRSSDNDTDDSVDLNVYNCEYRGTLLDNDEVSSMEDGFMQGYEDSILN